MKIPQKIKKQINNIIDIEGGYVDHPNDPGGETKYGITKRVAIKNGYLGDMKDLPREKAVEIYYKKYIIKPKFHLLTNPKIQYEAFEQGVNMGQYRAIKHLQKAYNSIHYQVIQGVSPFFKIAKTQSYQQAKLWINGSKKLLK